MRIAVFGPVPPLTPVAENLLLDGHMNPLSAQNPTVFHEIGDTSLRYALDPRSGAVEFLPIPSSKVSLCREKDTSRPMHPVFEGREGMFSWRCTEKDPLVQIAVRGLPLPGNWVAGESLRNGAAAASQRFVAQEIEESAGGVRIVTRMASEHGFETAHEVSWHAGDGGFLLRTSVTNTGESPLEVDMLSSFSLAGITPFTADDAPGRLRLHRFRSAWSNEAYHVAEDLEALNFDRSWGAGPRSMLFSQTGSLPVRKFHPFLAIEDKGEGVFWGAHLAWHGSWQMELYRRDDAVSISGGHGDFNRAHWMKRLAPGETFVSPPALVAAAADCFDLFCHRLVALQDRLAHPEPESERDLPAVFNEWCSTWGKPTHDYLLRTADLLRGTRTKYLVIDDGWAEKPEGQDIQFNGDWNVNRKAFPGGLAATCAAIRERGLVPGIWFEFEPCTEGTEAFKNTAHQLHLHGKVLQVGNRHFWDFRDPWTFDYLSEKVIRLLRESGFGYLKVDYNESIGLGCDGAESPGEGLRQHLVKVREFFEKIRREVPGIVVENCASGGHRAEPGMVALTSMTSFSDAHETVEIPVIAASMHRLLPARKIQIWAVARSGDTLRRLRYSLCSLFLGRVCISGDLVDLSAEQMALIRQAGEFYAQAAPVIRDGVSRYYYHGGPGRKYPQGWQALVRSTPGQALVVLHTFEGGGRPGKLRVPLPEPGGWQAVWCFGEDAAAGGRAEVEGGCLVFPDLPDFSGSVHFLTNSNSQSK